jgi:hypothetical protein
MLDTINLSWEVGRLKGAPPIPRFRYTATLVGEIIYYIGSLQQDGSTGRDFCSNGKCKFIIKLP